MLDLKGTIEIRTKRLVLRRFTLEDMWDAFQNWGSDEEVTKYLTWKAYGRVEDVNEYYETKVLPNYANNYFCNWAIEYNNEVIGAIDARIDEPNFMAHIGYCLGKKWWGNGIMPEALMAVIDYLFGCGIVRIEAYHAVENPKSGRVMEKCGMEFEGVLRKRAKDGYGKFHDAKMYSIVCEGNMDNI